MTQPEHTGEPPDLAALKRAHDDRQAELVRAIQLVEYLDRRGPTPRSMLGWRVWLIGLWVSWLTLLIAGMQVPSGFALGLLLVSFYVFVSVSRREHRRHHDARQQAIDAWQRLNDARREYARALRQAQR